MRFFEEIANRESRNVNEIVLYPEGLFYKAYDRSAFACISRIPAFKPSKKRIKYCAREMASIGFPAAALPKYFPTAPRPLPDGRVVIALKDRIDADACQAWKSSLPLKERRPRGSSKAKAYVPIGGRDGGTLFVHPVDLLPDGPAAATAGTTGPKQPALTTGGKGGVELPHLRQPAAPGPTMGPGEERGAPTELHAMREHPAQATGGRGATDERVGALTPEAIAAERTALRTMSAGAAVMPGAGIGANGGAAMQRDEAAEAWPGSGAATAGGRNGGVMAAGSPATAAMRRDEAGATLVLRASRRPKWLVRLAYKMLGINELNRETLPTATEAGLRGGFEAEAGQTNPETGMPQAMAARGESGAQPGAARPTPELTGTTLREAETLKPGAFGEPGMPGPSMVRIPGRPELPTPGKPGEQPTVPPRRSDEPAARKAVDPRRETREERAVRLIREFRLEAATPVECLLFVADLKKEIDGYL